MAVERADDDDEDDDVFFQLASWKKSIFPKMNDSGVHLFIYMASESINLNNYANGNNKQVH